MAGNFKQSIEGFKQSGELIKNARKQKGFTQVKLAELAGVSQGFIADLENGNLINPKRQKLYRIADILGIPFNDMGEAISYDEFVQFDQGTRDEIRVNESINEYKTTYNRELTAVELELLNCFRALSATAQQTVLNLISDLKMVEKGGSNE